MVLSSIRQSANIKEEYPQYLNDESGIVKDGNADVIFFPKSASEVQQIIESSNEMSVPFTVSGGGTGISGGRVPHGGWIIATDDMKTIENPSTEWTDQETGIHYSYNLQEIDQEHAEITIPIAITLKSLQNLCRELDWFYPVDPTERSSFLGGNIATNASGARTFKFGTTRQWVKSLDVLLPNAERIKLNRDGDEHELLSSSIII